MLPPPSSRTPGWPGDSANTGLVLSCPNRSEAQYSEYHPYLQVVRVTEGFLAEKEQNGGGEE